ncbi:cell division protein SepF [Anaerococcus sp. Marseille-Q5996]|uniref:cell division protein SepF n=1 Tax=Anaerococcus sp. Marseille-Q5996 TaxID=2972769 RepID=UPI0021C6BBBF|nr:cell division protein SepF [Anaerococcus sp. Marseille-Q5996]
MFEKFKDFIGIDDNYDDYDDEQLYYNDDEVESKSSSREAYTNLLDDDTLEKNDSVTYESGYSKSNSSYAFDSSSYDTDSYSNSSSSDSYKRSSKRGDNIVSMTENNFTNKSSMRISIQEPLDYETDAPSVINDILDKKVVVLNLEMVDADMRQRIFDFVSGAVYALDGTVERVTKGIFVISPKGVQVDSTVTDQISDGNYNQL